MPYRFNPLPRFLDRVDDLSLAGDVDGPASAVNNNFASFDGTTGKLIKDSSFTDTSFINRAGDTMIGDLTLAGNPTTPNMAANKAYVDAVGTGAIFEQVCTAGTTVALTATYANGTAGVGATLTNAGALAAFSVDGQSPSVNARILIKDQASTFQNGIYTLTTVGSAGVAWVLTRATDYDTAPEIQPGSVVPIQNGTVNANTSWLQTATVTTIGTDPITFTQFTYNASTFLQVANNLSDLANTVLARSNLGLGTMAVETATDYLSKAGNLSGLANLTTSRTNLGLGSMATETATDYLSKAGNLSGLANTTTARSNLGLGTAAVTTYTTGGSWVPEVQFGGASVGITYSGRSASYSTIGNIVSFTLSVELSNKGSSTGTVTITGLPFAAAATTIWAVSSSSLTFTGMVNARTAGGATTITLDQFASGGARAILTESAFTNSTFVQISGSYLA